MQLIGHVRHLGAPSHKATAAVFVRRCIELKKGVDMKIDTKIRHVTKPGPNLFLELGLSTAAAKRLQATSRKRINYTLALKQPSLAFRKTSATS